MSRSKPFLTGDRFFDSQFITFPVGFSFYLLIHCLIFTVVGPSAARYSHRKIRYIKTKFRNQTTTKKIPQNAVWVLILFVQLYGVICFTPHLSFIIFLGSTFGVNIDDIDLTLTDIDIDIDIDTLTLIELSKPVLDSFRIAFIFICIPFIFISRIISIFN